ncbi:hypothetical protein QOZ80_3AG0208400 [Eleusine coracana subsp. coracana]|nr:hypothetical protein QOZ80_3AG0208400 [Eleusine coracana subsp. coracana]
MAHQGVPKFGNWEEGDQPYTQYFENARKGKSPGRPVSQNDNKEDLEGFSKDPPLTKASPLRTGSDPMVQKPKDERRANREDELRRQEATARKPYAESPNHRYGDNASYDNAVRRNGAERSPLHPRQQARIANKGGVSSPSWERRGSSEGNRGTAPTTPGRSKMRPSGRGDETPDRGSAVPKFGEWDEKDPSTGEGFTDIFEKVREEKQSGSSNAPVVNSHAGHNRSNQSRKYESSGCSCFGWFRN